MFIVFVSSRTKFISLLLLVFIICAFFLKDHFTAYYRRHLHGVKPEVTFLEHKLGGLTRDEVKDLVIANYGEWQVSPVDAHYEPNYNSVIPELWGYEVDVPETVHKIMSASRAEKIDPVLKPLLPEITIHDYPSAFIERGNPEKQYVALMINVAWGTEHLPPMLEIFAAENASATFFVVGRWAEQNETILQETGRRGHLIASHGWSDAVVFPELTIEDMEDSIRKTNEIIRNATGQEAMYFTPHKGEYNELVLETVSRQGMRTVMWSIDTIDWREPSVEEMKARVLDRLHAGAIILTHPTENTVTLFKEIIPIIKNMGYQFVTMEEMFNPEYFAGAVE